MNTIKTMLAVAAFTMATSSSLAGENYCPDCGRQVCHGTWEERTVKKSCYQVECKQICIPSFRWPWQKCCGPRCGRVKTIRVLKKVDYECKERGCKWEVNCVPGGCCDSRDCVDK